MDGSVRGNKRQPMGQFESPLAQAAIPAQPRQTQGGLVDELQRQPRFECRSVSPRPLERQVPRPQTQVLGNQQPNADQGAGNLIGQ